VRCHTINHMKVYTSFQDFTEEFLVSENVHGFKTWTIVWSYQLDEKDIANLPHPYSTSNSLPFVIILADPLFKNTATVAVFDDNMNLESLNELSQKHYVDDTARRLKGMQPEKMHGFYEYEHWQDFKDDWLVRDGKTLIPYIYPLAFDLPDEIEYIDWRKSGRTEISYRRLIVTVYLYKKNVFHDIFIKNVTVEDVQHYLLLVKAQLSLEGVWK